MEEALRLELLAKTKQALDADGWNAVERLWQPWVQQGDAEAEYQLAYHEKGPGTFLEELNWYSFRIIRLRERGGGATKGRACRMNP